MNKFAKRLKELREEKGFSKTKLAKELNTTEANICRWENGTRSPNIDSIILLCQYFKCTSDYLIGLTDF
ncbi:MAG: helix-turn-helix transcriptional regulator [Clostridia bacterium]|nr:helix-turn-helix transcriptional regulator [Clostridia bacterium]